MNKHLCHVRVPENHALALFDISKKTGQTLSAVLREVIAKGLSEAN